MTGNPVYWDHQRERSTLAMLWLLVNLAQRLGRPLTRLLLWPVAMYFWVTAAGARRSSRDYLARVLGRPASSLASLRHFHAFASVSVDRVYLLSGRERSLEVVAQVPAEVLRILSGTRGCILLVAHFGSFEALRVQGSRRNESPIHIVLDRHAGRMATGLLERLNPQLAAGIIDAARPGPELMLEIKNVLEAGSLVGIMADRARQNERSVPVRFLGATVRVPAGPWIVAGLLDAPVVLGFGIYRGGKRYDCHLELFAEHLGLPRDGREQALQQMAQRYVARLEEHVHSAPYNWFNFYDYFHESPE